ncbi:hypothetical protein GCM10010465_04950 [Actinomadura fibrosa]
MGLGLLLVFIGPIGYLLVNQSVQEKHRKKAIFEVAAKKELNLNRFDFLPDLSLGLDEEKDQFLVISFGKKKITRVLDLKDISRCEIGKKYEGNKVSSAVDDIREVTLVLDQKNAPSETIVFYKEELHSVIEKEMRLQMANTWRGIISDRLQ